MGTQVARVGRGCLGKPASRIPSGGRGQIPPGAACNAKGMLGPGGAAAPRGLIYKFLALWNIDRNSTLRACERRSNPRASELARAFVSRRL